MTTLNFPARTQTISEPRQRRTIRVPALRLTLPEPSAKERRFWRAFGEYVRRNPPERP